MDVEYYIARRIKSSKKGGGSNIATRIARLSVAIGMIVMIVSLSIITGFRKEITELLGGFGTHIQVVNLRNSNSFETTPITKNQALVDRLIQHDQVSSISPYAIKAGITRSDNDIQGIMLKGVDHSFDWSFFESKLVEGQLPRISDSTRTKDVLVSQRLLEILRLELGQSLDMLFIEQPPRRDRFRICGVYNTGMNDMDELIAMTDIRNVQRLNRWNSDQITGYGISCKDINKLEQVSIEIDDIIYLNVMTSLDEEPDELHSTTLTLSETLSSNPIQITENLKVESLKDLNPIIFDWLKTHNINAMVIIIIMLVVSILGMISAILIIILERVKMIGTLKTLGMNNLSMQKIFIMHSTKIVLEGLAIGNLIGIVACMIQAATGAIKLDSSGYFLSQVPISLDPFWLIVLNLAIFVVIILTMTLPTLIVSLISPEKSLRYE